jgi:hypothetical protein
MLLPAHPTPVFCLLTMCGTNRDWSLLTSLTSLIIPAGVLVEGEQVQVYEPQERDRRCTRLRRILRPDQISIERRSRFLLALQHETQRPQAATQLLGGHVGQINACQDPGSL